MKARYVVPLALTLVGCSSTILHPATLTPDQASNLAQQLANEKAQTLYNCQPFRNGPPAQFAQGCWVWRDRRGQGNGDVEATVKFAADGAKPDVNVILLDSKAILRFR